MGIHFARFGLESGMVFEGTTGVYELLSFQFQMSKKEREICEFKRIWGIVFFFEL